MAYMKDSTGRRLDSFAVQDKAEAAATYGLAKQGGAVIVGLGDSHTERGSIPVPTNLGSVVLGGSSFFNQLVVRSSKLQYGRNAGISSQTTQQMVARFDTDVTPYAPRVVHILAGTNDTSGGVNEAVTRANLETMIQKTLAIGATPVIGTIPPRSTDVLLLDNIERINLIIKRVANAYGAHLIDYHAALVDPATGYFKAGLSTDGVHPNDAGAKVMSLLAVSVLDQVLPAYVPPFPTTQQEFTPNLLSGGLFLVDTNADGLADFWTIAGTATTSTTSLVTDPNWIGKAQRHVFAGAGQRFIQQERTGAFSVGDTVAFTGRLNATLEAGAGALDINMRFTGSSGNYTRLTPVYQFKSDIVNGHWYIEGVVPAGTTKLSVQINALSGAGTVDVGQVAIWNLTTGGML